MYLDYHIKDYGEAGPSMFKIMVKGLLGESPVMISFTFSPTAEMDPIYNPSAEEIKAAKFAHSMLLIGHEIDNNGTSYWEYHESYGLATRTNGGYWKLARGKQLIIYVVEMSPMKTKQFVTKKKRKINHS